MEDVGIFYGDFVHFTVFCYILWTFGIVRGNLVYFSPFWYFVPRKIWQPWLQALSFSDASFCLPTTIHEERNNKRFASCFIPPGKKHAYVHAYMCASLHM
jgi:hypothetical protein